jgi:hypothetical protein
MDQRSPSIFKIYKNLEAETIKKNTSASKMASQWKAHFFEENLAYVDFLKHFQKNFLSKLIQKTFSKLFYFGFEKEKNVVHSKDSQNIYILLEGEEWLSKNASLCLRLLDNPILI